MLNLRADSFHVLNLRAQRALMSSTNELNTLYTDVESDVLNLRAQEHALYWNTLYTDVESPSWLVSTRFHSKVERALTNQRTRVLNRIESQLRTTSTTTSTACRARTNLCTTLPSIGTRRARGGLWTLACSSAEQRSARVGLAQSAAAHAGGGGIGPILHLIRGVHNTFLAPIYY